MPPTSPEAKADQGSTVSVCLPARNEEATVGAIVPSVRRSSSTRIGLVDEVVVLDDGSTDATAGSPPTAGARVVPGRRCSPRAGPGRARATRCGSRCTRERGRPRRAGSTPTSATSERTSSSGLLGPLLTDPAVGFVKGCLRPDARRRPDGGGRVTELVARRRCSRISSRELAAHRPAARRRVRGPAHGARRGAVRRRVGRRARTARSTSSRVRHRVDRAGRPRRARAPQPAARRPRPAGDRDPGHRAAPCRARARRRGASRSWCGSTASTTERIAIELRERPPIRATPRVPRQVRPRALRVIAAVPAIRVLYTDVDGTLVGPLGQPLPHRRPRRSRSRPAERHRPCASRRARDRAVERTGTAAHVRARPVARICSRGSASSAACACTEAAVSTRCSNGGSYAGCGPLRPTRSSIASAGLVDAFATLEPHDPWNEGREVSLPAARRRRRGRRRDRVARRQRLRVGRPPRQRRDPAARSRALPDVGSGARLSPVAAGGIAKPPRDPRRPGPAAGRRTVRVRDGR